MRDCGSGVLLPTATQHACKLGCEGIVSKRLSSLYRSGRSPLWLKVKNPKAPAVKREAEEDWGANKTAAQTAVTERRFHSHASA